MAPNNRNKQVGKKAKTTNTYKPRTMPEPPPSVTARFLNNQVRDYFKNIKSYRVIQEKIFDVPKLVRNPEFEATIRTLGWDFLNGMVFDQANKTLTLEFYANARFSGKKYESYARGKGN